MNPKIEEALNRQINMELYSSYLYMAMSAYLKRLNLPGFSHWLEIQAREELGHALRLSNYVLNRGVSIVFEKIAKPPHSWESAMEVFKAAYEHEQLVTSCITEITDLAIREKDYTTSSQLQWFLKEQTEEEANELEIYRQLKSSDNSSEVIIMLDRELAKRVYVDPNAPVINAQP
ncbi:MAG TPA: ferritin [Lentisphaeria bacterium]|nr:MAG: hypothetical protein A2X47_09930 [Lentisphaerae bacterium GWF2_38_69]HBM17329.1 ferritin [Lentisphaeria bacterium]